MIVRNGFKSNWRGALMLDLKQLKMDTHGISVLYVEDNGVLRENASKLLKKFFVHVYIASDGKEGLETFKKNHPNIVITDIKMPQMDGFTLSREIKRIAPETEIIIMSAFDDKENLHASVKIGVMDFLAKPVNITELTEVLNRTVHKIRVQKDTNLFYAHLKNIFNYQSSMVAMLKDSHPLIANQMFLDFFSVDSAEAFNKEHADLGREFLQHDGFLFNTPTAPWFDEVQSNANKLYHVKLKNTEGAIRHLILKYQKIPEKVAYGILSLDDVTELNLLRLFDEKQSKNDENLQNSTAMFNLLEVIQRNSAKVMLHNYYKGLSITNEAIIVEIQEGSIVLKSTYIQQKAIQFEGKTLITSEALPNAIACDEVIKITFDKQSLEFKKLHFVGSSPIKRSTIRLVPDKHTVSLFIGENKFQGEISIEDISLDAVRLSLNALPAGLKVDDEVLIDMVLTMDNKPLIINTNALMFKKSESKYNYSIVFKFKFKEGGRSELVQYITKRQMAIIREFKGMQNG